MTNETELRELDRFIAEHIFGCQPVKLADGDYECRCYHKPHAECGCDGLDGLIRHYTTDAAAAMAVLKKCCEKVGPRNEVSIYEREDDFWVVSGGGIHFSQSSLTHAICSFAKLLFQPPESRRGNE